MQTSLTDQLYQNEQVDLTDQMFSSNEDEVSLTDQMFPKVETPVSITEPKSEPSLFDSFTGKIYDTLSKLSSPLKNNHTYKEIDDSGPIRKGDDLRSIILRNMPKGYQLLKKTEPLTDATVTRIKPTDPYDVLKSPGSTTLEKYSALPASAIKESVETIKGFLDPNNLMKWSDKTMDFLSRVTDPKKAKVAIPKGLVYDIPQTFIAGTYGLIGVGSHLKDAVMAGYIDDFEDLADVIGNGFNEGFSTWYEFAQDRGSEAMKTMGLDPTPESEVLAQVAFAPFMLPIEASKKIADSKTLAQFPNLRGLTRIIGFFAGSAAMKKLYKGPVLVDQIKDIVSRTKDIFEKEQAINEISDINIRRAQQQILEVEKTQAELEAAELLKKIDYSDLIIEDLSTKGERVKKIKQNKSQILDEQVNKAMEKIKVEKVKETKPSETPLTDQLVEEKYVASIKGPDGKLYNGVPGVNHSMVADQYGLLDKIGKDSGFIDGFTDSKGNFYTSKELSKMLDKKNITAEDLYPELKGEENIVQKLNELTNEELSDLGLEYRGMQEGIPGKIPDQHYYELKVGEGRSTQILTNSKDRVEVLKKVNEKLDEYEKVEPVEEIDYELGEREPIELEGDNSPFRELDTKVTETIRKTFEGSKAHLTNPESAIAKMINDVNYYLDTGKGDINKIRNDLSSAAVNIERARDFFDDLDSFVNFREMVSDAASWARKVERTENDIVAKMEKALPSTKLSMGVDPTEIGKELKKVKQKIDKGVKVISDFTSDIVDKGVIETEFSLDKANLLPTLLRDIANQNPSRTMIYELTQNSLDALSNKGGKIDINYENNKLTFADNGSGMLPEEVKKFFLVGGSIGKSGVETRGGYGLAKIALLLIPEKIKLTTIKEGTKSVVDATREDIYSGKVYINHEKTTEPNGTIFEALMPNEVAGERINSYSIRDAVNSVGMNTWTENEINFKSIGSGDKTFGRKNFDTEFKKVPTQRFSEEGTDVSIHFIQTSPYGYKYGAGKYPIKSVVTNKGLVLDVDKGFLGKDLEVQPDFKIVVDFERTPTVRDPKYPFLKNRTEISKSISKSIKDIVDAEVDKIASGVRSTKLQDFKDMVDKSPEFNGVKVLIPYKGDAFETASRIITENSDLVSEFSEAIRSFTQELTSNGEIEVNFQLTIDPNVYGFKSNKMLTGVDLYAINPFAITKNIASMQEFLRVAATKPFEVNKTKADAMTHTLVHEYSHTKAFSHSESFTQELARVTELLGHEYLYNLSTGLRRFYDKYSERVDRVTEDLEGLRESESGLQEFAQSSSIRSDATRGKGSVSRMEGISENKLYDIGGATAEGAKRIIDGAKGIFNYTREARAMKDFKPVEAAKMTREEFTRAFIEKSGNFVREITNRYKDAGYRVVTDFRLSKGGTAKAASNLEQLRKEVYSGLSRDLLPILDTVIESIRMVDIGKYKTAAEFKHPKGKTFADFAAAIELFMYKKVNGIRDLTVKEAYDIYHLNKDGSIGGRAGAYYDWMKIGLKDLLDREIIPQSEYDALVKHNYRRLGLIEDIYDRKSIKREGSRKKAVYDSGIERLSRGKDTDIYEPSSEVMAIEVFNRIYGRIANNEAVNSLREFAKNNPNNPFAIVKTSQNKIPSGWSSISSFEKGKRVNTWISPELAKEWIDSSSDLSYRAGQILRWASLAPIVRTFATGINWGFALANLPRDIFHIWTAARTYENGKFKGVYNSNAPIYAGQMARDLHTVYRDAINRGPRYKAYIEDGGGMEFLVHQGRLFQRGRHLNSSLSGIYEFMGRFGEITEVVTRLAIRERVIRNEARKRGITVEEASKNKEITKKATMAARDYMDFSQGGYATKLADNGLPYLSAAIIGTRGFLRTFKPGNGMALRSVWQMIQLGSAIVGLYIAANALCPKTMKDAKNSNDSKNNLIIPIGDDFEYIDDSGQSRYFYLKIPLDPAQKGFKKIMEASTDHWLGNEVDYEGAKDAFGDLSPVDISTGMPLSNALKGYAQNMNYYLNEKIFKGADEAFKYELPKWITGKEIGGSEEEITKNTPELYKNIGAVTGLSPERTKYAVEQIITSGTIWTYLMNGQYTEVFKEVPKEQKLQHLAYAFSQTPGFKRFIGVTNPYTKFAGKINQAEEDATKQRFVENIKFDTLVEGYLYDKSVTWKDVVANANSYKDDETYDRLMARYDYEESLKDSGVENKSFWRRMKGLSLDAKVNVFVDMLKSSTTEERRNLWNEAYKIEDVGGIISEDFFDKVDEKMVK